MFIDAEYTLDVDYCKFLGIDMTQLLVVKPEYGEQVFEVIEKVVKSKSVDFIVVDSVSAMVPKSRLEADTGTQAIGAQARMISNELPKLISPLEKSGCILVFINQLRVNIMGGRYDPYTTPGGMSLRHYTSVRVKVTKSTSLRVSGEEVGNKIKLEIAKNKVGKPKGLVEVTLMFDEGFSEAADLIEIAESSGVITRKGSSYYYGELKLGHGAPKSRAFLNANPEIYEEILLAVQQPSTQSSEQ
jgi:recombination protein RecA